MKMSKTIMAIGGSLAVMTTAVFAGYVQPQQVTVDLVEKIADGDQVSARTADNKVEFIGCGIRKISDGVGGFLHFGFCQATDAKEVKIICYSQDPELLDTISSSADYGYVTFSWEGGEKEEQATCTRIGFSNQSFYLPKNVVGNN